MSGSRSGRVAPAAARALTIVTTTGVNLRLERVTVMMMAHVRSDMVLETTGKGQTGKDRTANTIPGGPSAIVIVEGFGVAEGNRFLESACRARQVARSRFPLARLAA